jgi:hypothetical protein
MTPKDWAVRYVLLSRLGEFQKARELHTRLEREMKPQDISKWRRAVSALQEDER